MMIRKATMADVPAIMQIIDEGRRKMIAEGNTHQWINGYPQRELIEDDIRRGHSLVLTDGPSGGKVVATLALIAGPDPTYARIDGGQWLNDEPYYVVHRIASAPGVHGVMRQVVSYTLMLTRNIRIDTHRDNISMQAVLHRLGFERCGIIYLANGDERVAFQLVKND